jgi:pimeloyl-ACP methyl ester carboxylesterase
MKMKHPFAVAIATLALCVSALASAAPAADPQAIQPFHVNVADKDLADLRNRIAATRWPDKETVSDRSQGAQLAQLQELVRYWGTDYDWRKAEAQLNSLAQYVTTLDGVEIHFIWVRSPHPNALPMIMTHGWPGSVFEFIKVVGPLTDPTAHGGNAADAFDVVIPSIPGYGFSGKPSGIGWDPDHIARVWAQLMQRLEYTHYVAQGGDWGAPARWRARRRPGCAAFTLTCPPRYRRKRAPRSLSADRHRRDFPTRNARPMTPSPRSSNRGIWRTAR